MAALNALSNVLDCALVATSLGGNNGEIIHFCPSNTAESAYTAPLEHMGRRRVIREPELLSILVPLEIDSIGALS